MSRHDPSTSHRSREENDITARTLEQRAIEGFDVGGTALHGQNALLVPRGDIEGLRDGLGRLIHDPRLARCTGLAGQLHSQNFSIEQHGRRLEDIYTIILQSPRPSTTAVHAAS